MMRVFIGLLVCEPRPVDKKIFLSLGLHFSSFFPSFLVQHTEHFEEEKREVGDGV